MSETYQIAKDDIRAIQDDYIEGEGYERHPLDTWYALDFAIDCMNKLEQIEQIVKDYNNGSDMEYVYLAKIREVLE